MDVTPLVRQGSKIIQSYAGGAFRISGEVFSGGVIVTQTQVTSWTPPSSISDFTENTLDDVRDILQDCDVILLGTGQTLTFLPPTIKKALKSKGLSLDIMDTGAACRTYNVLMAEGRRVAAILMPFNTPDKD